MNITFLLNSGKNRKLPYYLRNGIRYFCPTAFCRYALPAILEKVRNRDDADYIFSRVDYYCRLTAGASLPENPRTIGDFRFFGKSRRDCQSVYFFDVYEYLRYFPSKYRWEYCPGDVTYVPDYPAIVKSRPLTENANSVLMKLDKVRHFIFLNDRLSFDEKLDKSIFRGKVANKPQRVDFMRKYFGSPICDAGDVSRHNDTPPEWKRPKLTLWEQLRYKFILSLEGNDVASNLKWVMSSNSIAVMPPPTCETWFMEGTLIPDYHYIAIKPDFSDLEERLQYYTEHRDEALRIIENAHRYIEPFKNEQREKLISLLVLQKYFSCTGQR